MSVRVRERKTSVVQYIDTARKLLVHTINSCRKFPKAMMFFITKDIVDKARDVYTNVVKANAIYPKTKLDIELRYKYLVDAKGNLEALDGLISMGKDLWAIKLSDFAWTHWADLITDETKLINSVINSDKKLGL